ncbi:biotin/lipoyl-binding protein [Vibrio sp. SS-MA-C1-2]|uniref:HlyD family secretion protein n=1 Tax=Vibrio sp. SS-MA-C1-2 TaxID=2908646 RepID=UPI001F215961|nr:biotin/lipoyl-binding protein [Vibrio sp. SS-MA-C1-2]UJF17742.1 biotin/lipoyl-binding protein [Vibrio sp. SS-MA-C1-2]
MLEGLAVWALFIYLLRLVGVPWNAPFKAFAYIGGGSWLAFVWIGLITWAPMDLSGGSIVQSPHIQLRPGSTQVVGNVDHVYINPNQKVEKGQLIYSLDDHVYQIAVDKTKAQLSVAKSAYLTAKEDKLIAITDHQLALKDVDINRSQIISAKEDLTWKEATLKRYHDQNSASKHSITESLLDEQDTLVEKSASELNTLQVKEQRSKVVAEQKKLAIDKAELAIETRQAEMEQAKSNYEQALWNLSQTKVYAPTDGYVTNFTLRPGQYVGVVPRMQMYTNEKYVLMRVNHQAIRNVKVGQAAEFATAVYPGKIFSAEVEGIIEATGESQASLLARETSVRTTTGQNLMNKHHFVRLKINEDSQHDIPVGSVGLAWVAAEKPIGFLDFLNVIRGIIIRMKSQIYYIYSL